jgi:hypothetical protein
MIDQDWIKRHIADCDDDINRFKLEIQVGNPTPEQAQVFIRAIENLERMKSFWKSFLK